MHVWWEDKLGGVHPLQIPSTPTELQQALAAKILHEGPRPELPHELSGHIRFARDPSEFWQSVNGLLIRGEGDCEDIVPYAASRLLGRGYRVKPEVVRISPQLMHTYLTVNGQKYDPSGMLERMAVRQMGELGWLRRARRGLRRGYRATRRFARRGMRFAKPWLKDPARRKLLFMAVQQAFPAAGPALQQVDQAIAEIEQGKKSLDQLQINPELEMQRIFMQLAQPTMGPSRFQPR